MRIAITRGGGLAGISQTTDLDSSQLPAQSAAQLEALADALPGLAAEATAAAPQPDEQSYELLVTDDSGRSRSFRYLASDLPEQARTLITWVEAQPQGQTRFNPLS